MVEAISLLPCRNYVTTYWNILIILRTLNNNISSNGAYGIYDADNNELSVSKKINVFD